VKQHLESVYRPSAINLIKFLSQGNLQWFTPRDQYWCVVRCFPWKKTTEIKARSEGGNSKLALQKLGDLRKDEKCGGLIIIPKGIFPGGVNGNHCLSESFLRSMYKSVKVNIVLDDRNGQRTVDPAPVCTAHAGVNILVKAHKKTRLKNSFQFFASVSICGD
jgi:hypothetical protein